jgi:hypothetical protein
MDAAPPAKTALARPASLMSFVGRRADDVWSIQATGKAHRAAGQKRFATTQFEKAGGSSARQ